MSQEAIHSLERVFRTATSFEELFDAFQIAIKNKIENLELYKILLANNSLMEDEISFFTEKIAETFSKFKYEVYLWTAKIYGTDYLNSFNIDKAVSYYIKALNINKSEHSTYVGLIGLYNQELKLPDPALILSLTNLGLKECKKKSTIYNALSSLYDKLENKTLKKKYLDLAVKHAQIESKRDNEP